MSPSRQRLVNGFIAIVLALLGFSIVSKREFWPFCNYPMFDGLVRHPEEEAIKFYTQVGNAPEELVLSNGHIDQLHQDFTLNAILQKYGWPSAKSDKGFRLVIEEMRSHRKKWDPAWAGTVILRAYVIHYLYPNKGGVRRELASKTLFLELTEPGP